MRRAPRRALRWPSGTSSAPAVPPPRRRSSSPAACCRTRCRPDYGARLLVQVERVRAGGRELPLSGGVQAAVGGRFVSERRARWVAGRRVRMAVPAAAGAPLSESGRGRPAGTAGMARRRAARIRQERAARRGGRTREAVAGGVGGGARALVRRVIGRTVGAHSPRSAAVVTAVLIGDRAGLDTDTRRRLQEGRHLSRHCHLRREHRDSDQRAAGGPAAGRRTAALGRHCRHCLPAGVLADSRRGGVRRARHGRGDDTAGGARCRPAHGAGQHAGVVGGLPGRPPLRWPSSTPVFCSPSARRSGFSSGCRGWSTATGPVRRGPPVGSCA